MDKLRIIKPETRFKGITGLAVLCFLVCIGLLSFVAEHRSSLLSNLSVQAQQGGVLVKNVSFYQIGETSNSSFFCNGPIAFTISVLTFTRSHSLNRLLNSLRDAEYENDCIQLVISIDYSAEDIEAIEKTREVATNFVWSHGPKVVISHKENQGLLSQWVNVWRPETDDERGAIFEDDLELSPLFYSWLKLAMAKYRNSSIKLNEKFPNIRIGGISLQRQYLINGATFPHLQHLNIKNGNNPYLYQLIGCWGFVPIASEWRKFQNWAWKLPKSFNPITPGLYTSLNYQRKLRRGSERTMWSQFHIYWADSNSQYILYPNLGKGLTLCANWKDRGLNFKHQWISWLWNRIPDSPRALDWDKTPGIYNFPPTLDVVDWKTRLVGQLSFINETHTKNTSRMLL